jgi:uncharacterized YccA/Bax inhibitor family protein
MSNPILNSERFSQQENVLDSEPMTIQGTISKVIMLFVCLLAGAGLSVYYILSGQASTVMSLTIVLSLVAFILVMITCFNVKTTKYLAPPYALCEGFVLGGISTFFESAMQGIVLQTVIITFAVLFVMLMLYKARLIQYTERMRTVLAISLLSICAVYLVQFIVSIFGLSIPGIFGNGPIGILFSLVVVGIASFSLIQDFYFIENASQRMLSKDYEWYGALGLMVTLVWLYLEILRLLAKLNSRR